MTNLQVGRQLKCVLMTPDYEILAPGQSLVLASINKSTAKKFAVDPASTLKGLDHMKIQERADYVIKRQKDEPEDQCIMKERRLYKAGFRRLKPRLALAAGRNQDG